MSFHYRYWAFGLQIESEFAFPELSESNEERKADLVIRFGDVPDHLEEPEHIGYKFEIQGPVCLIQTARTARMMLTAGEELIVQPGESAPMPTVRGLVLAWGIGVCLYQRKRLLLHGATLVKDGQAILLCGRNGAGKSRLAMEFLDRGYRLFDDNLSCIEVGPEGATVFPGSNRAKLWEDSLSVRGLDPLSLDPVLYKTGKYIVPIEARRPENAAVGRLYTLIREEFEPPKARIERLTGVGKLEALRSNVFLVHFCQALGGMSELMKQLFGLAERIPVYDLNVSDPRPGTDTLAELIEGNHEFTHRP